MIDYKKIIENDYEEEIYKEKAKAVEKYLSDFKSADFWKIVKRVGGSERRMLRLIDQMVQNEIISFDKDKKLFYSKGSSYEQSYCHFCNGDRVTTDIFDDKLEILKKIWKNKPLPTFLFDQRPVNMNTSLKRASYFLNRGDLIENAIVFLGDDDLTSIAVALLPIKCNITVLDVDKRIIEYINFVSKKHNLNHLKALEFNVNEDVPKKLRNKFDVLFTDPTPEKIPFTVFMNKSVELLKKKNSILYTSIYSSAMKKTIELQRIINKMNMLITDVVPEFTEYKAIYDLYTQNDIEIMKKYNIFYDEKSICFTESMFRLEILHNTKTIDITYNGSDLFGKATKRVIKDINKDIEKENAYLKNVSEKLIDEATTKFEG